MRIAEFETFTKPNEKPLVEEPNSLIETFLDAKSKGLKYAGQKGSPATIERYGSYLYRAERMLQKPLEEFTEEDADTLVAKLQEQEFSTGSINGMLSAVRGFFNWAMKSHRIDIQDSPFEGIMSQKATRTVPQVITETEFKRIVKAITDIDEENVKSALDSPRGANLPWVNDESRLQRKLLPIKLMFYGGLRINEAASLKVENILPNDGGIVVEGKGNKERFVPLPRWLMTEVEDYAVEFGSDPWVFVPEARRNVADQNKHLSTGLIHVYFKEGVRRAGLSESIKPHTLRHSFATHALRKTGRIDVLQDLLGHDNPTTTRLYARNFNTDLKEAAKKIWDDN